VTATLEFVRASRWYGPVIALNDVTTTIGPGVTGLLGPNGAGKSTFLKLAAGQLTPSQGEVRVLGRPPFSSPEIFYSVGLCPEPDAFWDTLTGAEFLLALLKLTGFEAAERQTKMLAALEAVGLVDAKDRKIGAYSKGMRQRLKLSQAIAHDPEVLLLDEPLTGVDPVNRHRIFDLVRRLGREGKTILVSSHILHEVEAVTRSVLLIHHGRILAEGDVREIRDLMDEHPHPVSLRARDARVLGSAAAAWSHVLSVAFSPEGEWVTIQTAEPDSFYRAVSELALDAGVSEMYSPDEDLESVFRYLVSP
jgi:ABC-2 type transport system ATP-binding protein